MPRATFNFARILLLLPVLPLAALAALAGSLLGPKARRTASEVAACLRDFLEGRGGPWDWDDFTSVAIADERLEAVRRKAAAVDLPLTDQGIAVLRELLDEAERLAGGR